MINEKIRRYVVQHGFGAKTPPLSASMSPDTFKQHYYHKKTLLEFCRLHNIPTQGLKNDLNRRVEAFLSGQVIHEIQLKKTSNAPRDSHLGLTLDRQVINYKSDVLTRAFFTQHIPGFKGFSAYVQKWLKQRLANGDVFTYADLIEEYKHFLRKRCEEKSIGLAKEVAHSSCQYNQFFIDYSQDINKKPHSAKEAWVLVRDSAGEKTYARYKKEIERITNIVGNKNES